MSYLFALCLGFLFGVSFADVFIKEDYDEAFLAQNLRIKELESKLVDRETELGYYKGGDNEEH